MKTIRSKISVLLNIVIAVLLIWLLTQLAERYRFRIDMTEEQRYSVSDATKASLRALETPVFVEVYLGGELPSNLQRLKKATANLLDEFSVHAEIQYKFIDPSAAGSEASRNKFYRELASKGIQPTQLNYAQDGQSTSKWIFPGAVVVVGNQERAVNLLKGNRSVSPDEIVNESIEGLEYELVSTILQLAYNRKRVGMVVGHGEPDSLQLAGFTRAVLEKYDLFRIDLSSRRTPLTGYDAVILPKPTTAFSEREKYLLDQYVMRGGSLLVFYDALQVNMDQASGEGTVAVPYETNLGDLLFRYGVRVNNDFVLDVNCGTFPVVTGEFGEQPQIQLLRWPFFPVISNYGDHPATKGLDASLLRFVSSMDTVKAAGIVKTPLLKSSPYTRLLSPPVRVAFNDLQDELRPDYFQGGIYPVGYLLEGAFTSLFANKFPPRGVSHEGFTEKGAPARVVVISDGDVLRNDLDPENQPLDIGFDPYANLRYANGELVLRLLDYLTDADGLIMTRAKEIKIRPLDRVKLKEEATRWRLINMLGPLAIILVLGLIKYYIRNKQYVRK